MKIKQPRTPSSNAGKSVEYLEEKKQRQGNEERLPTMMEQQVTGVATGTWQLRSQARIYALLRWGSVHLDHFRLRGFQALGGLRAQGLL